MRREASTTTCIIRLMSSSLPFSQEQVLCEVALDVEAEIWTSTFFPKMRSSNRPFEYSWCATFWDEAGFFEPF